MNWVKFKTSWSLITTMESIIFTLALVHFYSRIGLKRISAGQMVIYKKVEKNTTLYAEKKAEVKYNLLCFSLLNVSAAATIKHLCIS